MTVRKSVIVLSRGLAQMQKSLHRCQLAVKYWASLSTCFKHNRHFHRNF